MPCLETPAGRKKKKKKSLLVQTESQCLKMNENFTSDR